MAVEVAEAALGRGIIVSYSVTIRDAQCSAHCDLPFKKFDGPLSVGSHGPEPGPALEDAVMQAVVIIEREQRTGRRSLEADV